MSSRFAARLIVSITRADVGQRVSLRRRLTIGGYRDVVGVLESWDGGTLVVRRRDGERVEVPEDLVGTLLYLASPASEFLTGQTIAVNGGDYLH